MNVTHARVQKVIETVDCGLSDGLGDPEPGEMCVEAAVCFAFGLPHGSLPPCVDSGLRDFKIILNDSKWSSKKTRAMGMRKLAVLQLGTSTFFDRGNRWERFKDGVAELSEEMFPGCGGYSDWWPGDSVCSLIDKMKSPTARTRKLARFAEGVAQILINMKVPSCKWLPLLDK